MRPCDIMARSSTRPPTLTTLTNRTFLSRGKTKRKKPKTMKSSSPRTWKYYSFIAIFPIVTSTLILIVCNYPKNYNPIRIPEYSFQESIQAPYENNEIVRISEKVGEGLVNGPEDFAYDKKRGYLYTGCADGWIRRVKVGGDGEVEDWVRVGGRPLGLALASDSASLLVAEVYKGLLLVKANKEVQLLTNEAEGLKFKLIDGVDVASDGIIYFTDASYKYDIHADMLDILEGRPHGRVLSFDPSTNKTTVLVHDLHFANGLSLSPDQQSLIFCETPLRKCSRYHIHGEKKGSVEIFADNLPGFPDNIRYDGEGCFWIALAAGRTSSWDIAMKYPMVRKMSPILSKFISFPELEKYSGVMSVDLEGRAIALYRDSGLNLVTVGLRIGKYLYYGFLRESYIGRLELTS